MLKDSSAALSPDISCGNRSSCERVQRIGGVVANAAMAYDKAVETPMAKTRMSHNSFVAPSKQPNLKALAKECHADLELAHVYSLPQQPVIDLSDSQS